METKLSRNNHFVFLKNYISIFSESVELTNLLSVDILKTTFDFYAAIIPGKLAATGTQSKSTNTRYRIPTLLYLIKIFQNDWTYA